MDRFSRIKAAWMPLTFLSTGLALAAAGIVTGLLALVTIAVLLCVSASIAIYWLSINQISQLQSLVREDYLTGVGNQRALWVTLGSQVALAKRNQIPLSMVMIDLDDFKLINDRHGHRAGDRVLRAVADAIGSTSRGSDQVFRYGGDEFAVICPHTGLEGAAEFAQRARVKISDLRTFYPKVTACLGIAELGNTDTGFDLIDKADAALINAKQADCGTNQISLNSEARDSFKPTVMGS